MRIALLVPGGTSGAASADLDASAARRLAGAAAVHLARLGHAVETVTADELARAPLRSADVVHAYLDRELAEALAPERALAAFGGAPPPLVVSALGEAAFAPPAPWIAAAARVAFPSLHLLARARARLALDASRVGIVPPGIGEGRGGARRRPRPWTGAGPLAVLCPGERSEAAGTLDLAAALAALPAGSARLVALGACADAAVDREVLRVCRGRVAAHLGSGADPARVRALASECHLAALPSREDDGYALGLDDAVALGLPAWAAQGAAARERYERSSFDVLPAGEPRAWADAFRALLSNPLRSAEAFRRRARRAPTASAAAARLEAFLAEAVEALGRGLERAPRPVAELVAGPVAAPVAAPAAGPAAGPVSGPVFGPATGSDSRSVSPPVSRPVPRPGGPTRAA